MVKLKDLKNRVYSGRNCTQFDFYVDVGRDEKPLEIRYKRDEDNQNLWTIMVVLKSDNTKNPDIYYFGYEMPKSNMSLELIAATGLKYFQMRIKNEVQYKSNLDFIVGDIVCDM